MSDKLELTRADVDAVMDYIYQHVRASPNGRGYKVWERMLEFLDKDEPVETTDELAREQQGLLF